jgi:hypothetical protein
MRPDAPNGGITITHKKPGWCMIDRAGNDMFDTAAITNY